MGSLTTPGKQVASPTSSSTSTCASSCSTSPAHGANCTTGTGITTTATGNTTTTSTLTSTTTDSGPLSGFTQDLVEGGLVVYARHSSALKRVVLVAMARTVEQVWISDLRDVFISLDRSRSGTLSVGDFETGLYNYQKKYNII